MILYKTKTIKKRKEGLENLIERLKQLKKNNYHNNGITLRINNQTNWFYSYRYANNDIRAIKKFIDNGDLTIKKIYDSRNGVYVGSIDNIRACNTLDKVITIFES